MYHGIRDKKARKSLRKQGAKLLYLPPYSPDLNPIEHAWANLKSSIRKIIHPNLTIIQKITKIL
jgi:transposase